MQILTLKKKKKQKRKWKGLFAFVHAATNQQKYVYGDLEIYIKFVQIKNVGSKLGLQAHA
jgi:hypothetical protein